MAGKANFSVIKGDTFRKSATFTSKSTGTAVNLTGSTISGKVKKNTSETPLTCTITNAVEGKFTFELSSAQTSLLEAGPTQIEVKITYADLTVKTIIVGNVVVMDSL